MGWVHPNSLLFPVYSLTEAVFCLTNGILWVVGYVARDAGGFRCKHSFVEVIGESLFQPSTTDLEKEHSLQATVELLVALVRRGSVASILNVRKF